MLGPSLTVAKTLSFALDQGGCRKITPLHAWALTHTRRTAWEADPNSGQSAPWQTAAQTLFRSGL